MTKQSENSSFEYTKHGLARMQQRGFKAADIDLIAHCGTYFGDHEVFFTNKDADREIKSLKKMIKKLDRLRNRKIVIKNNAIVTCHPCEQKEVKRLKHLSCQIN